MTRPRRAEDRSSQRLTLLLQRSLRYSYRQRCWGCCPTILCEFFFPFLVIVLLALFRYGSNVLLNELEKTPSLFTASECSQEINQTTSPSTRCQRMNLVFHPLINETDDLVVAAQARLAARNCPEIQIW